MSDNQTALPRNTEESTQTLLSRLLMARGPGGQEDEVRAICLEELQRHCDEVWTDRAGNVIGLLKGSEPDPNGQHAVRIMGHMDEIAMLVKRVEPDGTLRIVALGGANPVNFGVCPVDILGDAQTLPGVLSFGSMHATTGSPQGKDVMSGAVEWKDVHIITRHDPQALQDMGVRPGTRVVLSQHWRTPFRVGDATAAHFSMTARPSSPCSRPPSNSSTALPNCGTTPTSSLPPSRKKATPAQCTPLRTCPATPQSRWKSAR